MGPNNKRYMNYFNYTIQTILTLKVEVFSVVKQICVLYVMFFSKIYNLATISEKSVLKP